MGIIHFLNVNEGDCIWIEHPSEHNTIIDISNGQEVTNIFESASSSGNHNQKNYPVNPIEYLKDRNVSTIFRFVLTHPDMDHMDGIKDLFETFEVLNFWTIICLGEDMIKQIGIFIKRSEHLCHLLRF